MTEKLDDLIEGLRRQAFNTSVWDGGTFIPVPVYQHQLLRVLEAIEAELQQVYRDARDYRPVSGAGLR